MNINGTDYGRAKLGVGYQWGKKQDRFIAGDGTVRVRDKTVEEHLVTFTLPRVSYGNFYGLRLFLTQTANYAMNSFQIVDDWGSPHTVLWWDSKVKFKERAGRFYSVTMTVRVLS